MSLIDKDKAVNAIATYLFVNDAIKGPEPRRVVDYETFARSILKDVPEWNIVRCKECRKSHIDGKTTHYLWCTEWGRSTDTFGYCERGEREGE